MATYLGTALSRQVRGKLGEHVYLNNHGQNVVRMAPISVPQIIYTAGAPPRGWSPDIPPKWKDIDKNQPEDARKWKTRAIYETSVFNEQTGIFQVIPVCSPSVKGYQWFVQVNTRLVSAGLPLVDVPPYPTDSSKAKPLLSLAWDVMTSSVGFYWNIIPAPTAGARVRCWIYSTSKLFHRQIMGNFDHAAAIGLKSTFRGAKGVLMNWTDFPGTRILGQMDVVEPDGKVSMGSNTEILDIP
jgi:hypothetical protein